MYFFFKKYIVLVDLKMRLYFTLNPTLKLDERDVLTLNAFFSVIN